MADIITSHEYTSPGIYRVKVTATNSIGTSTAYAFIRVNEVGVTVSGPTLTDVLRQVQGFPYYTVLDPSAHSLKVYDNTGALIETYDVTGKGTRFDISIASGVVTITDNLLNTIGAFTPGSIPVYYFYLVDTTTSLVWVFNQDGSTVGSFGAGFTTPLSGPTDAIQVGNQLYIVDSGNNRVVITTLTGTYVSSFGTAGTTGGQFSAPIGIASDGTSLFITDAGNNRVEVFDLSGTFISAFGTTGTGVGQFSDPTGITVDGSYVIVVDSGNSRVEFFLKTGVYVGEVTDLSTPRWVSADGSYIYILDSLGMQTQYYFSPSSILQGVFVLPSLRPSGTLQCRRIDLSAITDIGSLTSLIKTLPAVSANATTDVGTLSAQIYGGSTLTFSGTTDVGSLNAQVFSVGVIALDSTTDVGDFYALIQGITTIAMTAGATDGSLQALVLSSLLPDTTETSGGAYVVNVRNGSVTQYDENYAFNSFCEFNGVLYGFDSTGVYALDAGDDATAPIAMSMISGKSDFGMPVIKRMVDAWIGVKTDGSIVFSIITEDDDQFDYVIDNTRIDFTGVKADIGRGAKGRYLQWGLANVDGSDVRMDELELNIVKTSRRV